MCMCDMCVVSDMRMCSWEMMVIECGVSVEHLCVSRCQCVCLCQSVCGCICGCVFVFLCDVCVDACEPMGAWCMLVSVCLLRVCGVMMFVGCVC